MIKYVIGSIEPIFENDKRKSVNVFIKNTSGGRYYYITENPEEAELFDTKKSAKEYIRYIIVPNDEDDDIYREEDVPIWREEVCVYEVDVTVNVKKQVK